MSRISPSWSTARHRYIRFPAIRTTISSRCHRALGRGRPCRSLRAISGPNFSTQRRTVSYETSSPRSASSSSTSGDFRNVNRLTRLLLQHPVKPAHDQLVLLLRHAVFVDAAHAEAADHRLCERLLQPTRGIRISDDFRGGFG